MGLRHQGPLGVQAPGSISQAQAERRASDPRTIPVGFPRAQIAVSGTRNRAPKTGQRNTTEITQPLPRPAWKQQWSSNHIQSCKNAEAAGALPQKMGTLHVLMLSSITRQNEGFAFQKKQAEGLGGSCAETSGLDRE